MKHTRGRGVVRVGDLFTKYREQLKPPQRVVVAAFKEAANAISHISIEEHHCAYNAGNRTLSLRVSGMIKTEITLHKKRILEHMEKTLGKKNVPKEII